jgi:hypothetical protein
LPADSLFGAMFGEFGEPRLRHTAQVIDDAQEGLISPLSGLVCVLSVGQSLLDLAAGG